MSIPQSDYIHCLSNGPSSIVSPQLDKPAHFSLCTLGVASLVGGADAFSAMAAVHVYGNRRWLGWYNTPGSFQLAQQFMRLAKAVSQSSFQGVDARIIPFTLRDSESDHCIGPTFRAIQSGTVIEETSKVAAHFADGCAALEGHVADGRTTRPVGIAVAELAQGDTSDIKLALSTESAPPFASLPIATSVGACALCVVRRDWHAFGLILVGIIASGVSSLVLGSADFIFTHPEPARGSPPGHGILGSGKDMVLLKGTESAVNAVTRGEFVLCFAREGHFYLWCCSFLFLVQAVTQLLLVPQASLFGQFMFLISLSVSALYNVWLSMDKEKVHWKMQYEQVLKKPDLIKCTLGTRTAAAVLVLLVLNPKDPSKLLDELLPNDTKVWKHWKATISEKLPHASDGWFPSQSKLGRVDGFIPQEQKLLELLYDDARHAYDSYREHFEAKSS